MTSRFYNAQKVKKITMARYITRVQLKDAVQRDLELLDSELQRESFTRVKLIRSSGKEPDPADPREYNRQGNVSLQEVTAAVYKAATLTGKKYSFTVMKEKGVISA